MAAEGVHRSIGLSRETEAALYSQDVVKAGDDVCQQCYDSGCNAAQVRPQPTPQLHPCHCCLAMFFFVSLADATRTSASSSATMSIAAAVTRQGATTKIKCINEPKHIKKPMTEFSVKWKEAHSFVCRSAAWQNVRPVERQHSSRPFWR